MRVVPCAVCLLWLVAGSLRAGEPAKSPDVGAPSDQRFAEQAARLAGRQQDFDHIFSQLLGVALREAETNAHVRLDDRVRSVFGGLWIWGTTKGRPVLQNREDWALHFIGGGAFQGYWDAGTSAGLIKERSDARDPHNRYDRDDLAATMLGARWVDLATTNEVVVARRWVESWARRERTLERSLPRLQFGRMPQGKDASAQAIVDVWRVVQSGLTVSTNDTHSSPLPSKD